MATNHKPIWRYFQNELGNNIRLFVSSHDAPPRWLPHLAKEKFPAVHIFIEGPMSTSENTITLLEATNLRDALNELLLP